MWSVTLNPNHFAPNLEGRPVDSALYFDILPDGTITGASLAQFPVAPNAQGVRNIMRGTVLSGRVTAVREKSIDIEFAITPGDSPSQPTLTSHATILLDYQYMNGKTSSASTKSKDSSSYRWVAFRNR